MANMRERKVSVTEFSTQRRDPRVFRECLMNVTARNRTERLVWLSGQFVTLHGRSVTTASRHVYSTCSPSPRRR